MENNENFVVETTENVEQTTTEEIVTEPAKMFTQEDLNTAVGKAKARERAKIQKQYEREYGGLVGVLKAGLGKDSVEEITSDLTKFYEGKGVKIQKPSDYSAKEIEVLAQAEAEEIIRGGFEEVVEEVDRLTQLGVTNMTEKEKAVFRTLATHRQATERQQALAAIGVTDDVINSQDFQEFAKKFNPETPITDVYSIYAKQQPKKEHKTAGSMKQSQGNVIKDYYTPEEIERLTEDDLDNPKVWEAVRRSMTGG